VQVRQGVRVEGIEPGGVWLREEVEGGAASQRVTSELTVWAGGFVGSELPRSAGLDVNLREQVRVDPALRSLSHRNVIVVGDAAALEGRSAPLQLSCKVALPMAITGADNLARRLAGIPEQAFEFQDAAVCISLGRRAGVVDLRHPDASVRERIISGRWGAWLKESVCRFTLRRMHWERGAFWPAGSLGAPARLEAGEERPQIAS
jgi:NADH dehydrogenase